MTEDFDGISVEELLDDLTTFGTAEQDTMETKTGAGRSVKTCCTGVQSLLLAQPEGHLWCNTIGVARWDI